MSQTTESFTDGAADSFRAAGYHGALAGEVTVTFKPE
jgi:hypothetical protein